MKKVFLYTVWLVIGLLAAGCGQQPADQPGGPAPVSPSEPSEPDVAPVEQPAAAESGAMETPAAIVEEPAAPPETAAPESPMPALEGPALPEPVAPAPAAAEPPSQPALPSTPAEQQTESPAAGQGQGVLGAVGKSLLRAATGRTSGGPPPTFGEAPGYDAPPPR